jgi:hypothetical protein
VLPAFKDKIDGSNREQKREAWREITAKLRRDPRLRRELGPEKEADAVLAALEPTVLKQKFSVLRQNARRHFQKRRWFLKRKLLICQKK